MPGVYGQLGPDDDAWGAYAYNSLGIYWDAFADFVPAGWGLSGRRETIVRSPAQMISFGDSGLLPSDFEGLPSSFNLGDSLNLSDGLGDRALHLSQQSATADDMHRRQIYQLRHSGTFNFTFGDGHLEYRQPETFFDLVANPNAAARWNYNNEPEWEWFRLDWMGPDGNF
jgi:prepilin-type processing-associated H-X9-DG protein